MIDKDCYSYIFVCDNCGEGEEVSTWNEVKDCYSEMVVCDNWNEVLEFMREKEWQKKKNGNSRNHYCHECKEGQAMTRKQFYRAVFVFSTAIGLLLFAILITLLTKDSWHLVETGHVIAMIGVFALFPVYGLMCRHMGKMDERNRYRARITNLMETYQPHGIKFSQKLWGRWTSDSGRGHE